MSLSSTNNRNDYTGTGALDEYDYTFKIFREQDLLVTVRDTDGIEETLVLNTDYTVDGVGDVGGGTITLLDGDLADDYVLTIRRVLELKQSTDIRNQGPYFPVLHENQFDKHVMIAQQQQDEIDRSMRLPETVSASDVDTTLPLPVAGRTIGWNDDADGLANFANAGDLEVSAFIETVLDDTTSIIARDTLRTRGIIHVGDYGAVGDGTTDDSAALNAAAAAALAAGKVLYGAAGKTYRIESNVTMRRMAVDFSECTVLAVGTSTRLIIGGYAQNAPNPTQKFYQIYRSGGVNSNPTCRIIGAKSQVIHIDYCDYVDLYADTAAGDSGTDSSCAYSSFYFNYVQKLVLTANASTPNSSVQWINENSFFMKRTATLIVEGTYAHNNNIFHAGCFENAFVITFTVGTSNVIHCSRFEGTTGTISFASGTWHNKIIQQFESDQLEGYYDTTTGLASYSDSGNNHIAYLSELATRRYPLLTVTPATCQSFTNASSANQTTLSRVNLQAYGIEKFSRDSGEVIFESPLIPVVVNDGLLFKADIARFRTAITLYDVNRKKIVIGDHASMSSYISGRSGLTFDGTSQWDNSSNVSNSWFRIASSTVAYVKHNITAGSSATGVPFSFMSLELLDFHGRVNNRVVPAATHAKNAAVTSTPVRGFAPEIGVKVSNSAGGWFTCTFSKDTTLNGAEASGQTVITVTSASSVASGDIVGVDLDDGSTHWTTVNGSPAGNDVTLTVALPSDAATLRRVVFNRWTST